jgi:hypothetical protein
MTIKERIERIKVVYEYEFDDEAIEHLNAAYAAGRKHYEWMADVLIEELKAAKGQG